ncbi:hypothetical protein PENSPDRAFT_659476 [Peniophora sp. CONT]|nr:hypothetical protein PENSPDRAFT_659476 [Peniophora sp. CONT]
MHLEQASPFEKPCFSGEAAGVSPKQDRRDSYTTPQDEPNSLRYATLIPIIVDRKRETKGYLEGLHDRSVPETQHTRDPRWR